MMHPPRLDLKPRHTECRPHIAWDRESLLLSLTFTYSDDNAEPHDLRLVDWIDQSFGIDQRGYRLVLGEMDILLDAKKRIRSIDIRTNPITWQRCPLPPLPNRPDAVCVDFVVEYDENLIASYDLPIQIIQDRTRRELSFSFGDYASSRWVMGADGFVVGMTADHYLSEFRLIDWMQQNQS